jgi:hypothetical protein
LFNTRAMSDLVSPTSTARGERSVSSSVATTVSAGVRAGAADAGLETTGAGALGADVTGGATVPADAAGVRVGATTEAVSLGRFAMKSAVSPMAATAAAATPIAIGGRRRRCTGISVVGTAIASTVMITVALTPPTVTTAVVRPGDTPLIRPSESIVATDSSADR